MSREQVGAPLQGHRRGVSAAAVSNDCKWIVSGSYDKTLRVWELPSGKALGNPLVGRTKGVTCVAISSDDWFVVSGSHDGTVLVWESRSGKTCIGPLKQNYHVNSVCISRDNQQIVSIAHLSTVYVWSVTTGELLRFSRDRFTGAHLLWKAGYERDTDEEARRQRTHSKSAIIVYDQDIYIHDPRAKKRPITKVGHYDAQVRGWGVDINGKLWACLKNCELTTSTIVEDQGQRVS